MNFHTDQENLSKNLKNWEKQIYKLYERLSEFQEPVGQQLLSAAEKIQRTKKIDSGIRVIP